MGKSTRDLNGFVARGRAELNGGRELTDRVSP
jgi:hypothetical protein